MRSGRRWEKRSIAMHWLRTSWPCRWRRRPGRPGKSNVRRRKAFRCCVHSTVPARIAAKPFAICHRRCAPARQRPTALPPAPPVTERQQIVISILRSPLYTRYGSSARSRRMRPPSWKRSAKRRRTLIRWRRSSEHSACRTPLPRPSACLPWLAWYWRSRRLIGPRSRRRRGVRDRNKQACFSHSPQICEDVGLSSLAGQRSGTVVPQAMASACPIVIVGGGPAGAFAAERLACTGRRILLLDEKLAWEKPCGGGLTHKALERYSFLAGAH